MKEEIQFLWKFEAGEIPLSEFTHEAHVKLAWVYLKQMPLPEAMIRFRDELKRFAHSYGKSELYHETITFAFLMIIHQRIAESDEDQSWMQFRKVHFDLISQGKALLFSYYSEDVLKSARAKQKFILPVNWPSSVTLRRESDLKK